MHSTLKSMIGHLPIEATQLFRFPPTYLPWTSSFYPFLSRRYAPSLTELSLRDNTWTFSLRYPSAFTWTGRLDILFGDQEQNLKPEAKERLSAKLALKPKSPKNRNQNHLIYGVTDWTKDKDRMSVSPKPLDLLSNERVRANRIEGFDSYQSNLPKKQGKILLSTKLAYHESMTWTAYPKLAYPYLATWPEEERVSFVSFSWKRNFQDIDIETTNHRLPIRRLIYPLDLKVVVSRDGKFNRKDGQDWNWNGKETLSRASSR